MDSEEPTKAGHASEPPASPDLRQWMDTVWTHVFGFPARSADIAVVKRISDETLESRTGAIADLLWDHWMGGPDEPSLEQVRQFVVDVGRAMASAADEDPSEGS